MYYRTAVVLSVILVVLAVGMFGFPAIVWAAFLPTLKQGIPNPIPGYERALLEAAAICVIWKWMLALLALPIVVLLFTIAAFTTDSWVRRVTSPPSPSRPPVLWNPKAAACWSLLFSPAFGAFLHAQNAAAMGRVDEARTNRVWFYVSIAYFGVTLLTIAIPAVPDGIFSWIASGLLFGWFFSLGRKQITYVRETWRDRYPRKSWRKPLAIAFCFLIGAFAVLMVVEKLVFSPR